MAAFHHGISAQEKTQGILPMRNANVSVIGLVVTSTDADDDMYPLDTPVLLTGITQDNIDKAGTNGTLRDCLQAIRDIHNPTVVVLRVPKSFEADSLDVLLTCPARFGLMPKRFGAPELDTPDVVLKLVSIAKRRRGIVYASPRKPDGTLITDKAAIVAYRDTYGDRELCIIDGEWGVPGKSEGSDGIVIQCTPTTTLATLDTSKELSDSLVHARYRINDGDWVDYEHVASITPTSLSDQILDFLSSIKVSGSDIKYVEGFGELDTFTDIRLFNVIAHNPITAFNARFGDTSIRGLSRSLIDNNASVEGQPDIDIIISNQATKVEFVVTASNDNDLVYAIFGKDETVHSCAFATWQIDPSNV